MLDINDETCKEPSKIVALRLEGRPPRRVGRAELDLGVRITPHMLRHHAATAVAPFLTETDMMGRFGWRTSTMVRRYVDYKGAKDREAAEHADRALGISGSPGASSRLTAS